MLDETSRYDSYKYSGANWIGSIPVDWKVVRNGALFREVKDPGNDQLPVLSVSIHSGVSTEELTEEENIRSAIKIADRSSYKEVKPGYVAYNMMRAWQGGIGFVSTHGMVSPAYVVAKPIADINSAYFEYLYRTDLFIGQMDRFSKGITDFRKRLYWEEFKTLLTVVPPLATQSRIVEFLDEKTAEIDAAIAKKRRLIDLLNEQKAILINRAVTKGLNPDAAMKDSGVDWIGEIPAHWDVKQLRYISTKVGSGVTPTGGSAVYPDEGIYFLRSQNVHFDGLRLRDVKFISERTNREMVNSQVHKGDVLLNITGASIGRSCVFALDDKANVNQHVCIIRPKSGVSSQFLSSLFEARVGSEQIWLAQNGASREGLNFSDLRGFVLPVPPTEEQFQIQVSLSSTQAEFSSAFNAVEREISIFNEFKQILTANAVTGKIKI